MTAEAGPTRATMDIFRPRSIAIIGASADTSRFNGRIIPSLIRHGFKGNIYPVNPKREEIGGQRCYPSAAELPQTDCVIYALGPGTAMATLEACASKGVTLFFVAAAGFAETARPEDIALQAALAKRARELGMRLLGPNCIGFANFHDRVACAAAAAMEWPEIPAGDVGLAAQSGGLSFASVIYCGLAEGTAFSHIISTGNEADLDAVECAEVLLNDPDTHAIALIIEAVRDAPAFLSFLRRAGEHGKPVVVLKTGRSSLGKVMAQSHTGALAGSSEVFDMVCRQYGVTVAEDIDELFRIAAMFAKLRRSGKLGRYANPGAHVASFCLSGGHVGLTADHGSFAGLSFPPVPEGADEKFSKALGFEIHAQNPLDTTAQVVGDDGIWKRCTEIFFDFNDIQVVIPTFTVARSYAEAIRDLSQIVTDRPEIVVVCWPGGSFGEDDRAMLAASPLPYFPMPRQAARGVAALDAWSKVWAGDANGPELATPPAPRNSPARDALLEFRATGATVVTEHAAKRILSLAGVPVTDDRICATAEEAATAATDLGFPVVLKGDAPTILHKSDAGLVALGLDDADAVRAAFERLSAQLVDTPGATLTVQPMIPFDQELILGAKHDPEFGPVVALGLGGIFVEVLRDAAFRLAPVSPQEARRMIGELKAAPILMGARGATPVDLDALANTISALSAFVADCSDLIEEIDVNPLAVTKEGGLIALDGLMVLKG